ncbi:uncharacterized protein BO66DRAFT_388122 [Aspergillus aculeatinus CBS 121060]|uniref:Uncharacterized protein n=1 Tax=Aspergillus aculeatinus CBS 121060 TaxID=1448322 RepID=A0ACD1HLT3_9EURO|nr:hypothetical protein BO66DRAFT_388122 [Aspergillus aculeatinus CBS 121060]RAH74647.1 hypothetical protein BO66DRAFT_388122 [Aspergillus aculeatinus CBS 121060]
MSPSHFDQPGKFESVPLPTERPEVGEATHSQPRQQSPLEPDLSHHLYFEDNDGFFPPSWLGQKPPVQGRSRPSTAETETTARSH